jgi:hypothetical protein
MQVHGAVGECRSVQCKYAIGSEQRSTIGGAIE